jgi:2-polyprenyl-3-methyl-5-hydroxy-6-metoxy-1,4-benzoquinol methylase
MTDATISRTARQQREAHVYDERAAALLDQLPDDELLVDPTTPPFPNREHVEPLGFALAQLQPLAGRRVLEVGCGSGNLTTWLALQGAAATGVDVSEGMLRVARRRAQVNDVSERVTLRSSALEALDDPDGSYDVVLANQVLHHLELDAAMDRIGRLLVPGGRAVFVEPVLLVPDVARRMRNSRIVTRRFPLRTDTPDERSLGVAELERIERSFATAERHTFQLLCRLQNFVELSDRSFARLQTIDRRLLRLPGLWRLCRYVVLVLETAPSSVTRRDK